MLSIFYSGNATCKTFCLFIAALFLLTSCAQQFDKLHVGAQDCEYRKADFLDFSQCMRERLEKSTEDNSHFVRRHQRNRTKSQDVSKELTKSFLFELGVLEHTRMMGSDKTKKQREKGEKQAYKAYDQLVRDFKLEEKQMNEKAAAMATAVLLGAAILASCRNGGCSGGGPQGGGSSYSRNNLSCDLQGCCSHHGGVMGLGLAGRVVCNDGQYSPTCDCY